MLILFYLSIIFSIISFGLALVKESTLFLIITIICSFPSALYLAGYPALRFSIFIPFIYISIFYICKKRWRHQ